MQVARTTFASVDASALIDTGASHTFVSNHILKALDLKPVGVTKFRGVSQDDETEDAAEYSVQLRFNNGRQSEVIAVGAELGGKIGCLIGRDILSDLVLVYDGPAGEFELRFR